jgi:hypothetical protein
MADKNDSSTDHFERQKYQSEQLVTLIAPAVQTSAAWLKFLITVQGALAGAFGIIFLGDKYTELRLALSWMICAFGIVLALRLVDVIVRHQKWQAFFIQKHVAINSTAVFPEPRDPRPIPTSISQVEMGTVSRAVVRIGYCLVAGWVLAALLAGLRLATG